MQHQDAYQCIENRTSQLRPQSESWFYADPTTALSFLFGVLIDETNALQLNQSLDSFIPKTDYQLLMHLLSVIVKNDGIISTVYKDLMKGAGPCDVRFFSQIFGIFFRFRALKETCTKGEPMPRKKPYGNKKFVITSWDYFASSG